MRSTVAMEEATCKIGSVGERLPIDGAFVRMFLARSKCPEEKIATVLARGGLDRRSVDDPGLRIEEHRFTRILIALSRAVHDEFWGHGTAPVPLGTFRTFCRLITQCRTLGEAIVVGGRFYQLVVRDFAVKVRAQDDVAVVWLKLRPTQLDPSQKKEMQGAALFILYQLMCWLTDRRLPLHVVRFAFSKGLSSEGPSRAYQAPLVLFDQAYSGFEIGQHLLALPVVADERRMRRFLSDEPGSMLLRFRDPHRLDDKVKAILRKDLSRNIELAEVAEHMHMTPGTLRRRLAEECGYTFSDLRDAARRFAALELVRTPHLKLEAIAAELGFAEYSTFHRAFRRWTGVSPTTYRDHGAEEEHD